jgi:hypothetical protein
MNNAGRVELVTGPERGESGAAWLDALWGDLCESDGAVRGKLVEAFPYQICGALFSVEAQIIGRDATGTVSLFNLNFVIDVFHDPVAEQFGLDVATVHKSVPAVRIHLAPPRSLSLAALSFCQGLQWCTVAPPQARLLSRIPKPR